MKFSKGQSGNPGGRPRALADIQGLARRQTKANLQALIHWRDQRADPQVSLRAAIAIHEIAWGRPRQPFQHTGEMAVDARPSLLAILRGSSRDS